MATKSKLLYDSDDWSFDRLRIVEDAIKKIAFDELKLDVYPNQIEIISSDQMLEAYASIGLPLMYDHWSFGKSFIQQEQSYRKGYQGLAYEIVINSSPCISYLMEENSMTMQALVIAHACYGHNHFFKNNYLFKQWTDAEGILDYLQFAKTYISRCEEQHGAKAVEATLDACHAIMDHGVDKYKRPSKLSKKAEMEAQDLRAERVQREANELWNTIPKKAKKDEKEVKRFPTEPQENIMYFIEKHSPVLESWQRELVRIVRKVSQYFYPQRQTQVMNEGWASFTHYYIMNRLWEKGQISDGNMLEFIHSHAGVLTQRNYDSKGYSGFNPYALGFAMYSDIRRICTEPTKEDEEYFPHLVGTPWLDACHDAVNNYRDESFISQFLSPTLMRKWGLFEVTNKAADDFVTISNIQDARGYSAVRQTMSQQYSSTSRQPNIQVLDANLRGNRELKLQYTPWNGTKLDDTNRSAVIQHIKHLWGHDVTLS
jgi:stage V sporulation protein R